MIGIYKDPYVNVTTVCCPGLVRSSSWSTDGYFWDSDYLLMSAKATLPCRLIFKDSIFVLGLLCLYSFCVHAVPVMVTVEQFFLPVLPAVSQLFSHCLLPSSVSVMSCCHICPCDISFILIPTSHQLSKGLFFLF